MLQAPSASASAKQRRRTAGRTRSVRVAGAALVTPLGRSVWETLTALLAGRTTADRVRRLADELPADAAPDPATLAKATAAVAQPSGADEDRAAMLARLAIEQLDAPLAGAALYVGASKGAMLSLLDALDRDAAPPLRAVEAAAFGPCAALAGALAPLGPFGAIRCVVAACASGLAALDRAARDLRAGLVERAVVVSVEASLHPLLVASYAQMGALAPTSPLEAHVCRPLDRSRQGFTLCEAAAALLLEADDSPCASQPAQQPSARALTGRVLATACAAQPHDVVRAPQRFTALAQLARRLVADAGRPPLQLVQPHATGTVDNDERELTALAQALGPQADGLPVYASKGALGHAMGASGLVNAALGLAMARAGRRPPMPWLDRPVETPFALSRKATPLAPGAQLVVAAGFGGHLAGAVIQADPPRQPRTPAPP